jgi:hypothetical protein
LAYAVAFAANKVRFQQLGTDVMIFKIFSPKNLAKNWRFWLKTKLNFEKN